MTAPFFPRHLVNLGLALTCLSGEAAWLHMRTLGGKFGTICGAAAASHCALCPLSPGLLAVGLASLAAAARGYAAATRNPTTKVGRPAAEIRETPDPLFGKRAGPVSAG